MSLLEHDTEDSFESYINRLSDDDLKNHVKNDNIVSKILQSQSTFMISLKLRIFFKKHPSIFDEISHDNLKILLKYHLYDHIPHDTIIKKNLHLMDDIDYSFIEYIYDEFNEEELCKLYFEKDHFKYNFILTNKNKTFFRKFTHSKIIKHVILHEYSKGRNFFSFIHNILELNTYSDKKNNTFTTTLIHNIRNIVTSLQHKNVIDVLTSDILSVMDVNGINIYSYLLLISQSFDILKIPHTNIHNLIINVNNITPDVYNNYVINNYGLNQYFFHINCNMKIESHKFITMLNYMASLNKLKNFFGYMLTSKYNAELFMSVFEYDESYVTYNFDGFPLVIYSLTGDLFNSNYVKQITKKYSTEIKNIFINSDGSYNIDVLNYSLSICKNEAFFNYIYSIIKPDIYDYFVITDGKYNAHPCVFYFLYKNDYLTKEQILSTDKIGYVFIMILIGAPYHEKNEILFKLKKIISPFLNTNGTLKDEAISCHIAEPMDIELTNIIWFLKSKLISFESKKLNYIIESFIADKILNFEHFFASFEIYNEHFIGDEEYINLLLDKKLIDIIFRWFHTDTISLKWLVSLFKGDGYFRLLKNKKIDEYIYTDYILKTEYATIPVLLYWDVINYIGENEYNDLLKMNEFKPKIFLLENSVSVNYFCAYINLMTNKKIMKVFKFIYSNDKCRKYLDNHKSSKERGKSTIHSLITYNSLVIYINELSKDILKNTSIVSDKGKNYLHYLASNTSLTIEELEKISDIIGKSEFKKLLRMKNIEGHMFLHNIIMRNPSITKEIHQKYYFLKDLFERDCYGNNGLHHLARNNEDYLIELLHEDKISKNDFIARNNLDQSILWYASNNHKAFREILNHKYFDWNMFTVSGLSNKSLIEKISVKCLFEIFKVNIINWITADFDVNIYLFDFLKIGSHVVDEFCNLDCLNIYKSFLFCGSGIEFIIHNPDLGFTVTSRLFKKYPFLSIMRTDIDDYRNIIKRQPYYFYLMYHSEFKHHVMLNSTMMIENTKYKSVDEFFEKPIEIIKYE
jgi:hypothetical protein